MSRPSDLFLVAAIVAAIVWLRLPSLLLPVLFLVLVALSIYRWRKESAAPNSIERYRAHLIAGCIIIGLIHIPMILGLVPPNGMYGFRTALTRSSTDIWYAANTFSGWAGLIASIVSAGMLLIVPATAKRWQLLATFLLPILCAVAVSLAYVNRFA